MLERKIDSVVTEVQQPNGPEATSEERHAKVAALEEEVREGRDDLF